MPSPAAFCTKCGKQIASSEPRIRVSRSRDTYDSGGRMLARYCMPCWGGDPGPLLDGRHRRDET